MRRNGREATAERAQRWQERARQYREQQRQAENAGNYGAANYYDERAYADEQAFQEFRRTQAA